MNNLDIIIPVRNEAGNIGKLAERINKSLKSASITYKLIFVDDKSTDSTKDEIERISKIYPVVYCKKQGKIGKAYSIIEGSRIAEAEYIAMIDGDLQYPPEALPDLYELAKKQGVAVADRKKQKTSLLRRVGTKIDHLIFQKLLHGFECDTQSGLKVFKKEIIEQISEEDVAGWAGWAIDIPLLYTAREMGYEIGTFDIEFAERENGNSKINFLSAGLEIALNSISYKFRTRKIYKINSNQPKDPIGAGIIYKGKRYITHTNLPYPISALSTAVLWQKLILILLISSFLLGLLINAKLTVIIVLSFLTLVYFVDIIFTALTLFKSLHHPPEIRSSETEISELSDSDLPIYTILCPLYKEANVLESFVRSIEKIDWPKDKLQVLLLLEEDDHETVNKANSIKLPPYFKVLVVPDSKPKTKPKACNYGLSLATGKYVVIYDAEDRPEPFQLKKAFLGFKKANEKVICLQSRLNYYNPHQNLLTKLFTVEYSLWFDLILPGLQSIESVIPLGGTSNHFKTEKLKELNGWDPFNVTEDCDLGARIFKCGFKTAMIDSDTLEEANSEPISWLKQRSRWIKGYLQTYLVHTRDPLEFIKNFGYHAFFFQLIIGLRIIFMAINPILWLATISYFAFYSIFGPAIEAVYPAPIFYLASSAAIFGNFMYIYNYMIGCVKRGHYDLIKYVYLIPAYWLMASVSSYIAIYQLVVAPHYWAKTTHGLIASDKKSFLKRISEYLGRPVSVNLPSFPSISVTKTAEGNPEILVYGNQENTSSELEVDFKPDAVSNLNTLFKDKFRKVWRLLPLGSISQDVGILIGASITANFINYLFNGYLGRAFTYAEFGTLALLGNIFVFVQVFIGAIGASVTHKSAAFLGKYSKQIQKFRISIRSKSMKLGILMTAVWLISIPIMSKYFNTASIIPFLLFSPSWFFMILYTVDSGFLKGNLKFKSISILILLEAVIKLVFAVISVQLGYSELVYLSVPVSLLSVFLLAGDFADKVDIPKEESVEIDFPKEFYITAVLIGLASVTYLSLDLVLAKHYLSAEDAGKYAILALSGKVIFFLGSLFSQFINPLISKESEESSNNVFKKLLISIIGVCSLGYIAIGIFGRFTAPILFGEKALSIVHLLPLYTLGVLSFTIATGIVLYHQVRKRPVFPLVGLMFSGIQIYAVSQFHNSLSEIATTVTFVSIAYLITVQILQLSFKRFEALYSNLSDLLGLFSSPIPAKEFTGDVKKILIFNWRDTNHVWSGGAELYIHELAKRWRESDYEVTLFCGNDGKSETYENVDGVNVVRRGGFYTVYLWAFLYYIFKFRGKYDIVIDCENGIPFFTPLYAGVPVVLLLHHVHKNVFKERYSRPVAAIGEFLEATVMPIVYRNERKVTVSESSKSEMIELGLEGFKEIEIVNPGIDLSKFYPSVKTDYPSVIYLGRLKPWKSIDTLINAISLIKEEIPEVKLKIAGFGESRDNLEKLVKKLGLENTVSFLGKVSDDVRLKLLGESWVFAYPSTMEGWGIAAIEANACGTPVVASDVPGLRDSVKNPTNGFLVEKENPKELAEIIELLLGNNELRKKMEVESVKWASKFTWEKSASKFLSILEAEMEQKKAYKSLSDILMTGEKY